YHAAVRLPLSSHFSTRSAHHPALPSFPTRRSSDLPGGPGHRRAQWDVGGHPVRDLPHPGFLLPGQKMVPQTQNNNGRFPARDTPDRKSTRLNSSHVKISYAVFCLKKKRKKEPRRIQ